MHTLGCQRGHTFTRTMNTGSLGKTSFRSSRSYARRLFIFFIFLSPCFFSFPIFSSLLPVTYAVAKIMVEKVLLGTLILQLLAWLFILDVWFAFFTFLSVWQLSVVDWSIVVCRRISLWFCTMMIYRIKVLLWVTFNLPPRRWERNKKKHSWRSFISPLSFFHFFDPFTHQPLSLNYKCPRFSNYRRSTISRIISWFYLSNDRVVKIRKTFLYDRRYSNAD